jgi:uncharacterized protein (TIGR01777 family)
MRVFVTGGTGLIGRRLIRRLVERGDHPVVLSRRAEKSRLNPAFNGVELIQGDPAVAGGWAVAVDGCDAVINLAGENLFARRWDPDEKRKVRDSRVFATENVVAAIGRAAHRPKVLAQASAIGYYGPHGDETLDESSPQGSDFLAGVCRDWEQAGQPAEAFGCRVALIRIGVVFAKGEGALGVMAPIFQWTLLGTPVGNDGRLFRPGQGRQWMSWIHVEDIAGIFLLAVDHPDARGPINGTSPNPERNVDFSRALAKVLHRFFVPAGPPDFFLKAVLGEVADVVTKGQRVIPNRALELGYAFQFKELVPALEDIFRKRATRGQQPAPQRVGGAH